MTKLRRALAAVLAALVVCTGLLYWTGPSWLAPVEDFPQGPGGAMAYSSLIRQVRAQYGAFWAGQDVHLVLTEPEFSGMVASALLSGQGPDSPIRKVRADLADGAIGIDTVLRFPQAPVPERFQGPFGLRLRLAPTIGSDGSVRFRIGQATAGRLPIPVPAIRLAGNLVQGRIAGFDARQATIDLPLGDMLSAQLGRRVHIASISVENDQLRLVVSLA